MYVCILANKLSFYLSLEATEHAWQLWRNCRPCGLCNAGRVADAEQGRSQGVARVAKAIPNPFKKKIIRQNNSYLFIFYLQHSHCTSNCTQSFNRGETRLEYLMMLQIHRSDTPVALMRLLIDALKQLFATTAARILNFLIWTYACTSVHCTAQYSFLNINI